MDAEICALAPSDWQIRSVEDVCKRVTSGGTPSRTRPEYFVNGSWPWVKTQELQDAWIDRTEEKITDEAVVNSSAKVLPANTILLAMYGATVGQLGILRTPMTCNQASCALIVDPDKADFGYLYHHLRYSRSQLKSLATGAAQQNLSGTLIKSLRYPFPLLPEQRAIAHVLGTLDDLIELNRETNEILEEMARALFKSWFVDFDPVRAKLEGRPPAGMDAATAALFPDHFQDSELGQIPKGWRVTTIGDTCQTIFSGGTPSTQNASYWGGEIPWLSSGETRSTFITGTEKTITRAGVENSSTRVARAGCTVIAGAGQGHTRGQTSLLTFESYINQSVVALAAHPEVSSDLFLFFDLARRYEEFRQLSDSHSSRGSLTTKLLAGVKCVLPPHELVIAFDKVAQSIASQITAQLCESRDLATLRDTLLPKLLSGEITAHVAEDLVAAST